MSQATSSTLSVAITCDRTGYLSKSDAKSISQLIYKQISSEAMSPDSDSDTIRPSFSSEHLYADRAIKVWCANDQTLTWLKKTVACLTLHYRGELVVKNQSEIQKRVNCKFEIPNEQRDIFPGMNNIMQVLCYQNSWIDLMKCELSGRWDRNHKYCYEVMMEIPENQIPTLMKAERRLSIGLTMVYVKFEGPDGELNSDVPKGWDPDTETIL